MRRPSRLRVRSSAPGIGTGPGGTMPGTDAPGTTGAGGTETGVAAPAPGVVPSPVGPSTAEDRSGEPTRVAPGDGPSEAETASPPGTGGSAGGWVSGSATAGGWTTAGVGAVGPPPSTAAVDVVPGWLGARASEPGACTGVGGGEVSVFAAAGDAIGCSFDGSSGRRVSRSTN